MAAMATLNAVGSNGLNGQSTRLVRLPPLPALGPLVPPSTSLKRKRADDEDGAAGAAARAKADAAGAVAGATGEARDGQVEAESRGDEEAQSDDDQAPWRTKDFLTGQPFTLHRLTPLHALPVPGSSAAIASCRDLRAYLLRRLTDESAVPAKAGGPVDELEVTEVEIGKVDLADDDGGVGTARFEAVGWEITFVGSPKTAKFVLLPPTPSSTRHLPDGISYFPLLLASAPTARVQAQFLDWLEGRHDVNISRVDKGTSAGWRVGEQGMWEVAQAVIDTWSSSVPPTRDVSLVFALPPPLSSHTSALSLSFPSSHALSLLPPPSSPSSPSPSFESFLKARFADCVNVNLDKLSLVKLAIGEVALHDQKGSSSAEATVRFFKGALGGDEMVKVLDILRKAAASR